MDWLVQTIGDWSLKHFLQEKAVIMSAPLALVVCTLVLGAIIYFALRWNFKHRIVSRNGTIRVQEERIQFGLERIAGLAERLNMNPAAAPEVIVQAVNMRIDGLEKTLEAVAKRQVEVDEQLRRYSQEIPSAVFSSISQSNNAIGEALRTVISKSAAIEVKNVGLFAKAAITRSDR